MANDFPSLPSRKHAKTEEEKEEKKEEEKPTKFFYEREGGKISNFVRTSISPLPPVFLRPSSLPRQQQRGDQNEGGKSLHVFPLRGLRVSSSSSFAFRRLDHTQSNARAEGG